MEMTISTAPGHEAGPVASVIVPVYNGASQVAALLECLQGQDFGAGRFEVIVVDDGSTDGTAQVIAARFPTVRVVTIANSGSYAARNAGIAVARGRVLAFTDADCRPARNWLSQGIAALSQEGVGLVAGAVVVEPKNEHSAIEFYDLSFGINQRFYAQYLGFGATANLFAKREVVEAVGGFDGRLRSGGDQKICHMAAATGAALRYSEDAVIRHEVRTTALANMKKVVRVSEGLVQIAPRWSQLRMARLSGCHRDFFDYERFLKTRSWWFRVRFRAFYYAMGACFIVSYVWATLFGRKLAN